MDLEWLPVPGVAAAIALVAYRRAKSSARLDGWRGRHPVLADLADVAATICAVVLAIATFLYLVATAVVVGHPWDLLFNALAAFAGGFGLGLALRAVDRGRLRCVGAYYAVGALIWIGTAVVLPQPGLPVGSTAMDMTLMFVGALTAQSRRSARAF